MSRSAKRNIAFFFAALFTIFIGESSLHSFIHTGDDGHTHLITKATEAPSCHEATTADPGLAQIGLETDVCKICASFLMHATVEGVSVSDQNFNPAQVSESFAAINVASLPKIGNLLLRGPPTAVA